VTVKASFIFDLDGTLIDSVYQHVLSWREAFDAAGLDLSVWRIHRRIGMSGGLMLRALTRELHRPLEEATIDELQRLHREAYLRHSAGVRALPGAGRLLKALSEVQIPWAIATSGERAVAMAGIARLGLLREPDVVVTRNEVAHAKPNPDLFLAAAERLGVDIREAFVVGDSVWDLLAAQRAGSLGIGVLSGGYGRAELERAHAYRVYEDPLELLLRLDELGVRDIDVSSEFA
jgi:HAD superfamily hydrolase (TIGR01509 family)